MFAFLVAWFLLLLRSFTGYLRSCVSLPRSIYTKQISKLCTYLKKMKFKALSQQWAPSRETSCMDPECRKCLEKVSASVRAAAPAFFDVLAVDTHQCSHLRMGFKEVKNPTKPQKSCSDFLTICASAGLAFEITLGRINTLKLNFVRINREFQSEFIYSGTGYIFYLAVCVGAHTEQEQQSKNVVKLPIFVYS